MSTAYDLVVGLEVHIQLATQSKLFCADATVFGAQPNTQVSAISLAHPGTLPMLNTEAINMAIKLGLALGSTIQPVGHFDRKHYFYPDLPKGYQTSQLTHPILEGGELFIDDNRSIAIHHVHLEEDAGKSIHDLLPNASCIDLNRAGMPLLELVTEPVIFSSDDAFAFLTNLRKLVRWLGICDGNMEEGSLRADANISVKPAGSTTLGTKVEVKNLNSIRNVKRAIEAEAARQTALLQSGEKVVQQTRGYNAYTDTTAAQREKEEAHDYRYFPCPDIPPFTILPQQVAAIAAEMPALPHTKKLHFESLGLTENDAAAMTEDRETATYFEALLGHQIAPKVAANWLMGPVRTWCNQAATDLKNFLLPPQRLAEIANLVVQGKVDFSAAATKLLPEAMQHVDADIVLLANRLGIIQVKNDDQIKEWVNAVLSSMPDKVTAYKAGKKNLFGLFMGEVKKVSQGKADAKITKELLEHELGK